MTNNKLNILITRPEKQGRVLAQQLGNIGITSLCQPLFDYQARADKQTSFALINLHPQAIFIFVSVAAVEFANNTFDLQHIKNNTVIAVGLATQHALRKYNINALTPEVQTSEGLLSLAVFRSSDQKDIIIVRGDGGRELIATELKHRGASVSYLESYQRVWRKLTEQDVIHWQKNNINCIVITSNAILEKLVHLINNSDSYWKESCLWVVASSRIAEDAKKMGLAQVINANGASDKVIIEAISQYGNKS